MKPGKILNITIWALLLVSAILVISLIVNLSDNVADPTMGGWINTNLAWAYIMLAIAAGLIVVFGVKSMVSDKKTLKNGLGVLVIFAVIGGISYLISSDAMPQFLGVDKFIESGTITPNISRLISTGLNVTYILIFASIAAMIWSSISRILK